MLRNTIVEVCCCNSKLLHFFGKSLIEGADAIVVLRCNFRREELLDVDDHRYHNSDVFDIHDWNDHAASTQNTTFPNDKRYDGQQVTEREILDSES